VQLSAPAEEQQAIYRLFDHLQSNPQYVAALALHFEELHNRSRRSEDIASSCAYNPKTDLRLIALIVWVCRISIGQATSGLFRKLSRPLKNIGIFLSPEPTDNSKLRS
jgi:hypothetical protein